MPISNSERSAIPASIDVHTARDLVRAGHKYLDVRTAEEFGRGHVQGAINVPYWFFTASGREENPMFLEQVGALMDKDDGIVVACASGGRSIRAATDMLNADIVRSYAREICKESKVKTDITKGFKNAKNMQGGHAALVKSGLVDEIQSKL